MTTLASLPSLTVPDPLFQSMAANGLVWLPEVGMGYFPVQEEDEPYRNGGAQAYWDKYVGYSATPMGRALTRARTELVRRFDTVGSVLDVGIGCGAFLEAMHAAGWSAYGYDVSPVATNWLQERGLWRDPYQPGMEVQSVTLWDVLEHLPDPGALLERVQRYVFVSLPVFRDAHHVLQSKHFRPDEHRWYWTVPGLVHWMGAQGFHLLDSSRMETELGREDVATFVFQRRAAC